MTGAVAAKPGTQPFHWWGLPWTSPNPRTLAELVEHGTVRPTTAQFLAEHVRRGGSITVAAGASGAGKSTLAHALSAEIPPNRVRVYIRGRYEPFEWLGSTQPCTTTILVNEISPHLPVYCWGEQARTVLQLAVSSYQVVATLHAASIDELRGLLQAPPICASETEVVALNLVVFLDTYADSGTTQYRIASIVQLEMLGEPGRFVVRHLPE